MHDNEYVSGPFLSGRYEMLDTRQEDGKDLKLKLLVRNNFDGFT